MAEENTVSLTLVDENYKPLAIGGVYLGQDAYAYALWGTLVARYPQIALHGIRIISNSLRECEIYTVYAEADRHISKAKTFLEALGGKPVHDSDGNWLEGHCGPLYLVDLRESKL